MRPEFLSLSDHALAERMHRWEAQSPDDDAAFEKFRRDHALALKSISTSILSLQEQVQTARAEVFWLEPQLEQELKLEPLMAVLSMRHRQNHCPCWEVEVPSGTLDRPLMERPASRDSFRYSAGIPSSQQYH